ncbi:MAG TPA: hypothetical protein VGR21_04385, partial [Cryptosporangiaceae bacterium]|nr:hypothetical protein [Cryptosporangiaceae bacterium]
LGKQQDLKREWAVSMQAIIERAWDAKLIKPAQRTSLYKGLSYRGWRVREPLSTELAPERPELAQMIGAALAKRGLSHEEIANMVGFSRPDSEHPFKPEVPWLRAL